MRKTIMTAFFVVLITSFGMHVSVAVAGQSAIEQAVEKRDQEKEAEELLRVHSERLGILKYDISRATTQEKGAFIKRVLKNKQLEQALLEAKKNDIKISLGTWYNVDTSIITINIFEDDNTIIKFLLGD